MKTFFQVIRRNQHHAEASKLVFLHQLPVHFSCPIGTGQNFIDFGWAPAQTCIISGLEEVLNCPTFKHNVGINHF